MTAGYSHDIVRMPVRLCCVIDRQAERARQRPGSLEPDRVIDDYLDSASASWSSVFIAHSWVQVSRNNTTPF